MGGLRVFDFDECGDFGPPASVLRALGLADSYPWLYRSGSGNGWGLAVLCSEAIPAGVLSTNGDGPGVFEAKGNGFDHLELRWRDCQNVLPPSKHPTGPGYQWQNGAPATPPAAVTAAQIVAAFQAVTLRPQPAPAPSRAAPVTRSPGNAHNANGDYLTAKTCLARLASWRCDDYGAWVSVGMALSGLGANGLELWDWWSRGQRQVQRRRVLREVEVLQAW